MLKIKDNVDLKELEKYGIFKIEGHKKSEWDRKIYCGIGEEIYIFGFNIINKRKTDNYNLEMLYDLIKADLVEKVEEKE